MGDCVVAMWAIHTAESSLPSAHSMQSPYSLTEHRRNRESELSTSSKKGRDAKTDDRSTLERTPSRQIISRKRPSSGLQATILGSVSPALMISTVTQPAFFRCFLKASRLMTSVCALALASLLVSESRADISQSVASLSTSATLGFRPLTDCTTLSACENA